MTDTCYLAGPFQEGNDWRSVARGRLHEEGVSTVSPSLAEEYWLSFEIPKGTAAKILTQRDKRFATESEYVLANFTGATKASIGTCIELGWAHGNSIIVAVLPSADNVHWHPIVENVCDYIVGDLATAVAVIAALSAESGFAAEDPEFSRVF